MDRLQLRTRGAVLTRVREAFVSVQLTELAGESGQTVAGAAALRVGRVEPAAAAVEARVDGTLVDRRLAVSPCVVLAARAAVIAAVPLARPVVTTCTGGARVDVLAERPVVTVTTDAPVVERVAGARRVVTARVLEARVVRLALYARVPVGAVAGEARVSGVLRAVAAVATRPRRA